MFDFGKLKNNSNCFCIFRNSRASHTKLCNFRAPFLKRLGKATAVMRVQMSEISAHVGVVHDAGSETVVINGAGTFFAAVASVWWSDGVQYCLVVLLNDSFHVFDA